MKPSPSKGVRTDKRLPKDKIKGRKLPFSPSKNNRIYSIIIFAFAFLLYANTLNHDYVLDDDVVYLKNNDVQKGLGGIKSILTHSFIYGFTGHNDQSYRPVVLIIFAIEKEFFGNNPHTGHLINILFFALSCILLYKLLELLFSNYQSQLPAYFTLLAALLFAAHPIHTEAVANIKGRDDILNFIFFVLSLTHAIKYYTAGNKKHLFYSLLFFFFALLSKEMAVTFLAVIPLALYLFKDMPVKKMGVGILSFIGVFLLYMLIRSSVLDAVTFDEKMSVLNNSLAAATNESERIATALLILGKYLQLLFFPHPLSWDYSFNQIPIVGFSNFAVISTVIIFLALGVFSIYVLYKRYSNLENKNPTLSILAFCVLHFFITMSVVSNIFIMIGSTLGERFLFIPSIAFCMAVPILLNKLGKNVLIGTIGIILLLFSLKTFDRNKDWKNKLSLFASGVEAAPNSSRAQSALGSIYRENGEFSADPKVRMENFKKSIPYYLKAIEILPDNTEALYNIGVSYYNLGDKENALKVYERALEISPEYITAANNAGVIHFERNEFDVAKKYFMQVLQYSPNNSDALGNLGAINHNQGNMKEAIEYYNKALTVNPGNQNIRSNLEKALAAFSANGK